MKTNLLTEINRIKEVMGLSLITEAGGGGVLDLITGSAKFIGDVEQVAVKSLDELEYAAFQAAEGSAEKLEFKLVKDKIDEIANEVGVDTTKTLSEILSDVNKLTSAAGKEAQKKMLRFLNGKYDDIAELTTTELKKNDAVRVAVSNGEILPDAMKQVLKDFGLPQGKIDDVVKTFFKGGDEISDVITKLGIDIPEGQMIANEVFQGLEIVASNKNILEPYKEVIQDTTFMTNAYKNMVSDIQNLGQTVNASTVEAWFNRKVADQLDVIAKTKNLTPKQKSEYLTFFRSLVDPTYSWVTKYKTKQGKWGKSAAVLTGVAALANTVSLITGGITALKESQKTDDEIEKEFSLLYDENETVVAFDQRQDELDALLANKKITQEVYDYESEQNWLTVKDLYDRWRRETYAKAFTAGYYYPLKAGYEFVFTPSGKNTDNPKFKRRMSFHKRFRDKTTAADTGQSNTGGGQTQSTIIDDVKVYLGKQTRKDDKGRDVPAYDLTDFTFEDLGNNKVKWTIKSTNQTGTLTKQSDGSFK